MIGVIKYTEREMKLQLRRKKEETNYGITHEMDIKGFCSAMTNIAVY